MGKARCETCGSDDLQRVAVSEVGEDATGLDEQTQNWTLTTTGQISCDAGESRLFVCAEGVASVVRRTVRCGESTVTSPSRRGC